MPLDKKGNKILYKPWPNTTNAKYKYWVYVKKNDKIRKIGFGDKSMEQFKDKGGHWSNKDHGDPKRRKSYLARAKGIKNKQGDLTWKDKNSANYWSIRYLW